MTTVSQTDVTSVMVQHGYIDHAERRESEAGTESSARLVNDGDGPTQSNHSSEKSFPVRLHYMLSDLEKEGLSHIASWQPHGRCFAVHDHEAFEERILP